MKPIALSLLLTSLSLSAYATDYRYDDLGRLITAIHPSGHTLNYQYDASGNLLHVTESVTALYDVQGEVSAAGQALPNVQVYFGDYTLTTNAQGIYSLSAIPAGSYNLSASAEGYQFPIQAITVAPNALQFNLPAQ